MSKLDPHEILGVSAEDSPRILEDAYRRRLRECDPAAVSGLDPRIQEIARQVRREVEVAYLAMTAPEAMSPEDQRLLDGLEEKPEEQAIAPKSYWRAIILTLTLPGSGSWYAGGRTRGLIVMGLFALFMVWIIQGVQAAMNNAPQDNVMGRLMFMMDYAKIIQGPCYGAMALTLGDAILATWAHNDRLKNE
jgi:hypothetical protein